ncbi:MAG: hypothetical protein ACLQE9_11295 [Roseiarcus sp.]
MEERNSSRERWRVYRPSKSVWFWSCVGCVVATMVVGFAWGGWVTRGKAALMSAQAAQQATAELAAAYCVSTFDAAPDASTRLAALKAEESWQRAAFIDKGGWAKPPGVAQDVYGAADLCASKLVSGSEAPAKASSTSG